MLQLKDNMGKGITLGMINRWLGDKQPQTQYLFAPFLYHCYFYYYRDRIYECPYHHRKTAQFQVSADFFYVLFKKKRMTLKGK